MRGCLFILILAAVVVSAAAWFGSPVVASGVIDGALRGSGYSAATSTVRATSDPPPKLLLGKADRVEINGTDVDFRTFHAAKLDLVLTDVDLLARTAGGISGRIEDAEMRTTDGVAAIADVTIEGSGRAAAATIVVGAGTVTRVVREAFQRQFGVAVDDAQLVAPDILRISAGATTIEGRLVVDDSGAIALTTPLGSSTILTFDPSFPLRLRRVSVAGGDLRIDATLDAAALLGG
jgi:hypothetical protein